MQIILFSGENISKWIFWIFYLGSTNVIILILEQVWYEIEQPQYLR